MDGRTDAELSVLTELLHRGGMARSAELIARGHRQRVIAALVADGRLLRIRRVWVALPQADSLAHAAARENVVISCVTQARRLGLWVTDAGPIHVAAAPHGAPVRVSEGTVVHWAQPLVPRPPGTLFDSIENVLALAVSCQPSEAAQAMIESALRQGVAHREALLRLPISERMRVLVERANPWADSGLETLFRMRLRWLRLPLRAQIWILDHRVDLLIGDRLVVQIDGGHHVGPQRDADIAHDAALTLLGYHVIPVSYGQIIERWHEVQDAIMRAVAQGLHRAA
jgi:very-short-patch-repair endonuclease